MTGSCPVAFVKCENAAITRSVTIRTKGLIIILLSFELGLVLDWFARALKPASCSSIAKGRRLTETALHHAAPFGQESWVIRVRTPTKQFADGRTHRIPCRSDSRMHLCPTSRKSCRKSNLVIRP